MAAQWRLLSIARLVDEARLWFYDCAIAPLMTTDDVGRPRRPTSSSSSLTELVFFVDP